MTPSLDETVIALQKIRTPESVVVLVTGVFDLLHREHRRFLHKAAQAGNILIIAIESDYRVRQIKGPNRPLQPQGHRRQQLLDLKMTKFVCILPDTFSSPEDHEKLIALLRPNILAVSSHTAHLDKKMRLLTKYGGTVKIVHQHNPAVSTTQIIAKARK